MLLNTADKDGSSNRSQTVRQTIIETLYNIPWILGIIILYNIPWILGIIILNNIPWTLGIIILISFSATTQPQTNFKVVGLTLKGL